MFATYGVKVEQIILFVKIMNRFLKDKNALVQEFSYLGGENFVFAS